MTTQSGKQWLSSESARYQPTGYHMIRTVEITNFRGIDAVTLENLGRVNVLVGPNGSGKTAFMEALYLASGNSPENLLRTKQWRGREIEAVQVDMATLQNALWADTFRDPNIGRASINLIDDLGALRSVNIEKTAIVRTMDASGEMTTTNVGMTFTWDGPEGHAVTSPEVTPVGIQIGKVFPGPSVHFLPARMNISETETARTYSRLVLEGDPKPFRAAFGREFAHLSELDVQAPAGQAALYARMANGRKLPLTMISGGISHLAAIMVRLAANKKSVLLIDEIENGFYYDKYESIWRTLYELAVESDSQIFASTHSIECLRALSRALPSESSNLRFIRTRLDARGEVLFQKMSGDGLFKALQIGEVR